MGMDPLDNQESFEVTFTLSGPVKRAKFQEFRKAVEDFLDACSLIDDGITTGKKLQVREQRSGVRKNAP